jgi:hypothetical protein
VIGVLVAIAAPAALVAFTRQPMAWPASAGVAVYDAFVAARIGAPLRSHW